MCEDSSLRDGHAILPCNKHAGTSESNGYIRARYPDARVKGCEDGNIGIEWRKHVVSGTNCAEPAAHHHQLSGNIGARARVRNPGRGRRAVDQGAYHKAGSRTYAP